jgi:citrate lyase subunit beta/citryl-CoA lyase
MIPKSESVEGIQRIERMVMTLEKERNLPVGKIQFDLIVETAMGVVNVDSIATASPRIMQMNLGQGDLAVDLGVPRFPELNFHQYFYPENRLLYAACSAKVQPCGLGAQENVDFTSVSMGKDAMFKACQHAFRMGYMGAVIIHPGWVNAVNEGFKPPAIDLELARRVKTAIDDAYAQGEGSVKVDGRMYDVANMKYVNAVIERSDAVSKRDAEKATAVEAAGGVS